MNPTLFVPRSMTCAIQALLSPWSEMWQSLHLRVSVFRTVCGKCVLKAWLE
jgi:hypothetical protein